MFPTTTSDALAMICTFFNDSQERIYRALMTTFQHDCMTEDFLSLRLSQYRIFAGANAHLLPQHNDVILMILLDKLNNVPPVPTHAADIVKVQQSIATCYDSESEKYAQVRLKFERDVHAARKALAGKDWIPGGKLKSAGFQMEFDEALDGGRGVLVKPDQGKDIEIGMENKADPERKDRDEAFKEPKKRSKRAKHRMSNRELEGMSKAASDFFGGTVERIMRGARKDYKGLDSQGKGRGVF